MLIDDKEISNFIMKKHIKACLPETTVFDFLNPDEAFAAIPAISPDIIFLDLNMPMMNDGWNFLDRMREEGLSYQVIILTSSISDVDIDRAKEYNNVKQYISKPIETEQLIEIFEEL